MRGPGLERWADRLARASSDLGREVRVDPLALLGERVALDGPRPPATRVVRSADAWVAVTLARDWDRDAVPAWLGVDPSWESVERAVAARSAAELVEGAELLGLAVGVLGERRNGAVSATVLGAGGRPRPGTDRTLRVLDLSALWAGPLCAALLGGMGADVVKVESTGRPDASRQGNPALFARLNAGKRSVALDLGTADGREALARLVRAADVVVESARPRAMEQLGIVAAEVVGRHGGPEVWVSITGHGRGSNRAGFGDDAAFAGGLAAGTGDAPTLWGDAPADPITGLVAAASAAEALVDGQRVVLDASLAGAAAEVAASLLAIAPGGPPKPADLPRPAEARPFGADTAEVLDEWASR